MNIVLMGYMGCGKSLVGSALSNHLQFEYIDLDHHIETQEKKSVSSIFEDKGEVYFRKIEKESLKTILKMNDNIILSLGGGTPCFSGNLEILKENENTQSIYLKTSLDELVSRLFDERNKRPLIAHLETKEALHDFIRKHIFERSFYYNQANYSITTDGKTPEEICEEIKTILF